MSSTNSPNPGPTPALPWIPDLAQALSPAESPARTTAPVLAPTRYLTMAYVAAHAPRALRYFGVKQSLFDLAHAAATGRGNAPPSPPPPEGSRNCDEVPDALARTASPPLAKAQEPKPAPTPEPAPAPKPAPAPEPARAGARVGGEGDQGGRADRGRVQGWGGGAAERGCGGAAAARVVRQAGQEEE